MCSLNNKISRSPGGGGLAGYFWSFYYYPPHFLSNRSLPLSPPPLFPFSRPDYGKYRERGATSLAELKARHPRLFSGIPVSHEAVRPLTVNGAGGTVTGFLSSTLRFGPNPNSSVDKEGGSLGLGGGGGADDYRDVLARLYLHLQSKYSVDTFDVAVTANVILTKQKQNQKEFFVYYGQDFSEPSQGFWRKGEGGERGVGGGILISPHYFIREQFDTLSPSPSSLSPSSLSSSSSSGPEAEVEKRLSKKRRRRGRRRRRRQKRTRFRKTRGRGGRGRSASFGSLSASKATKRNSKGGERNRSLSPLPGGRRPGRQRGDGGNLPPLYDRPFLMKQPGDAYRFPPSLEFSEPLLRRLETMFSPESSVSIHSILNVIILLSAPLPRWDAAVHQKGLRRVNVRA